MKRAPGVALIVVFAVAQALAQDTAAVASAQAVCGSKDTKFEVKQDSTQHPTPPPDPDKALVYVVQDLGEVESKIGCELTRVGMDGSWVGANRCDSYFFFSAEAGEHHLCVNWQSRFGRLSKAYAMANFTAEAGKVYYFRDRIIAGRSFFYLDLDPINSDQGKFLVSSSELSVWHAKK